MLLALAVHGPGAIWCVTLPRLEDTAIAMVPPKASAAAIMITTTKRLSYARRRLYSLSELGSDGRIVAVFCQDI